MSVDSLNNMRQECESLREELRVLSEKLLKQHDAALESQVSTFANQDSESTYGLFDWTVLMEASVMRH